MAYNSFFSIGAAVLWSQKLAETCTSIPLEKLFLETDTEPIHISEIYTYVAQIYGVTLEELRLHCVENAAKVGLFV